MRTITPMPLLIAVIAAACAGDGPIVQTDAAGPADAGAAGAPAFDIGGTWDYAETAVLVGQPTGVVVHITCANPDGVLTIDQNGSTFTGTLTHATSNCTTKEGDVVPAPWPLPYQAVLSGRITGRAIHIDQYDAPPGPPIHCPKNGTLRIANGDVVEMTTVGRCDLSALPFPMTARNSGTAVRP